MERKFTEILLAEKVEQTKREFKAPEKTSVPKGHFSIFLAGTIDMGNSEDWQAELSKKLLKEINNIIIFNPRRDDWDCVDSETKAITIDGIKSYNELSESDLILTWNKDKDILEYKPIQKINYYNLENSRNISRFIRNNDEFLFTENHNHISRKSSRDDSYDFYNNKLIIQTSERKVRAPTGRKLLDSIPDVLIPEGDKFLEDHYKLAAWILSEGSIYKKENSYHIVIAQYITNEFKVKRIMAILNNLDIKYRYDNRMFILDKDAVDFILGFMNIEKYKIPRWIKLASSEMKKIFIEEYGYGDGSYVDDKLQYIAFSQKYIKFAEEMQILAFETGICTKLRNKTSGFGHPVVNICFHNFGKKNYSFTYSNNLTNYSGVVWCPTTENSTWVAYRNGTPFITGNSSWKQDIKNKQFNEQVTWELSHIEECDVLLYVFGKDSQSPITLAELGIGAGKFPDKCVVLCPEGYFRKGNVDIICHRYGIKQINDLNELKTIIKKRGLI